MAAGAKLRRKDRHLSTGRMKVPPASRLEHQIDTPEPPDLFLAKPSRYPLGTCDPLDAEAEPFDSGHIRQRQHDDFQSSSAARLASRIARS